MGVVEAFLLWAPPVLLAITLHEAAHGYVARYFGDATAFDAGRISLNPLRHIDPVGTILVPGVLYFLSSGLLFGWAKPVPVNFARLRNPKRDMLWVSLAGPLANLVMGLCWAVFLALVVRTQQSIDTPLAYMAVAGISINAVLFVFNLLPLPPLDGGRIVTSLLPLPTAIKFARIEPYGIFIVLVLLMLGWLPVLLGEPVRIVHNVLLHFADLFL
ncbi:MAG: site-2 protease family protein [Rhodocyclaceae bacterium]|nr:site-2 protease family protein [Rhodocyclaceae bacterium]